MCSDKPIRGCVFSAFWHAELEAQKKRIAEAPENGDNDEGDVLALPSEQIDESNVAARAMLRRSNRMLQNRKIRISLQSKHRQASRSMKAI